MTEFLKPLENIEGFVKHEPGELHPKYTAECPLCHGYGGWNLQMHAYGPGVHFKAACSQCWGWGYVDPTTTDATCVHEFKEISRPAGNRSGLHTQECVLCKRQRVYDTSD